MSFSIRLSEDERRLADDYAKMHAMTLSEAFKKHFLKELRMNMT